jgi:hypothetical protein
MALSANVSLGAGGLSVSTSASFSGLGIFVPNRRSIGGIIAQVTIQEQEHDELTITEHPIEQGAPINDHAFKRPSEVQIRAGWSTAWAGDVSATGGGVYSWLLGLQASLHPFDLYTGKRVYRDMMIQSLVVTTDQTSEFALMAEISCRQVIIVRTSTAKVATSSDPAKQGDPEKTAPKEEGGSKQTRNVGSGSDYGGGQDEVSRAPVDKHDEGPAEPTDPDTTERARLGMPNLNPDHGLLNDRTTEEGDMVEAKAKENLPPPDKLQADVVTSIGTSQQMRALMTGVPPSNRGYRAPHQRLLRERAWQQMSRSRRSRGGRSARA